MPLVRNRFKVGNDLLPFSADATLCVYDARSDNGDVLVHVDPDGILTPQAARNLAVEIAAALNASAFFPEYPED